MGIRAWKKPKTLWENRSETQADLPVSSESDIAVGVDLKQASRNRCVSLFSEAGETDSYRILRTQIQQLGEEKNWKAFMITSALPGEGKTLTAINLAVIFAKSAEGNALLIDCDLKHQNVHQYLSIPSETGLIGYLLDEQPIDDIILRLDIGNLKIVSGARTIHDSSEMLGSRRMKRLVSEIKTSYNDHYIFLMFPRYWAERTRLPLLP